MTRPRFRVTYDSVTPESAEQGETDSQGYMSPGNWQHDDPSEMTLREAKRLVQGGLEDCGRWFTTIDADHDYRTGAQETRSIHPPKGITQSSYRRLSNVLTGRR